MAFGSFNCSRRQSMPSDRAHGAPARIASARTQTHKHSRYDAVARVMAAARSHGPGKSGFVTDPNKEN
jgi:hypothetical protein